MLGRRVATVLGFTLLAACEPLPDPAAPSSEERPCRTDDDCEMAQAESNVRQALCGSGALARFGGGRSDASAKDEAACGQMPNMRANVPEPTLACFRGTCVSLGVVR